MASWRNFWNLCHKNDFPIKEVEIQKAPEPEEIKWQNVGFSSSAKYKRKAAIWLLTILLIGISLGISIGISKINKDSINQYVSFGISIVVTAVNVGIQLIIMMLSTLEN